MDAFNVETGDFSDSDFIQVLNPPTPPDSIDAAKSAFANMEGEISTAGAENMRAFATVDNVPFLEWKRIFPSGGPVLTTRDVQLAKQQSGEIWIAFYQNTGTGGHIIKIRDDMYRTKGSWENDDYCGNGPHGPRPGGWAIRLTDAEAKKMTADQRAKFDSLSKDYAQVAAAAAAAMGKAIDLMNAISETITPRARG